MKLVLGFEYDNFSVFLLLKNSYKYYSKFTQKQ